MRYRRDFGYEEEIEDLSPRIHCPVCNRGPLFHSWTGDALDECEHLAVSWDPYVATNADDIVTPYVGKGQYAPLDGFHPRFRPSLERLAAVWARALVLWFFPDDELVQTDSDAQKPRSRERLDVFVNAAELLWPESAAFTLAPLLADMHNRPHVFLRFAPDFPEDEEWESGLTGLGVAASIALWRHEKYWSTGLIRASWEWLYDDEVSEYSVSVQKVTALFAAGEAEAEAVRRRLLDQLDRIADTFEAALERVLTQADHA